MSLSINLPHVKTQLPITSSTLTIKYCPPFAPRSVSLGFQHCRKFSCPTSTPFIRNVEYLGSHFNRHKARIPKTYASSTKISVPSHGYDYYELLAVDPNSSLSEIKSSYRWLQKRCHPDVAGEIGHRMAILLNEAYSVLSNHSKREAYDQVRAYWLVDDSFITKPLYSVWAGHEHETRAVFVDEVQCIGCLKCAVIASNTFAVENRFGRARAIRQWGDDETTINDAINSCPVDCIRWVDRSKIPILEYLMSKQARFRIGINSQSGLRMPEEIFTAAEKFMRKRAENLKRQSKFQKEGVKEDAKDAAEGIRVRSGRFWDIFVNNDPSGSEKWKSAKQSQGALIHSSFANQWKDVFNNNGDENSQSSIPEELRKIHEAANRYRWVKDEEGMNDEYWIPYSLDSSISFSNESTGSKTVDENEVKSKSKSNQVKVNRVEIQTYDSLGTFPSLTSLIAGLWIYSRKDEFMSSFDPLIESPLPPLFTSGLFSQIVFAMAVWYCIGSIISVIFILTKRWFGLRK